VKRRINLIVVHCAATKPDMDIGVAEIREWHRKNGWDDVGYHYVIRLSGVLEHGRPIEKVGAHAQGHNARSVGICLVGGLDAKGRPSNTFNRRQMETLRNVVEWLQEQYPGANVLGHRDLPGVKKACPCFDVRSWCVQHGIVP
jgi:N-acetylmuramoyl-L-alanine amidase